MRTKTTPRRQAITQVIYEYVFVTAVPAAGTNLPVIAFDKASEK